MQAYDVFLTPTLATPPAALGVFKARGADRLIAKISALVPLGPLAKIGNVLEQLADRNFRFVVSTPLANLTGEPAISLPLHWTPSDLLVGMMFSAKIYQEATLLVSPLSSSRRAPGMGGDRRCTRASYKPCALTRPYGAMRVYHWSRVVAHRLSSATP